MSEKCIILTGGGSAGHVTPNLALVPALKEAGYRVIYVGSDQYIESKLVPEAGLEYYGITTGMLRRYRTLKNITDPFKVFKGIHQTRKIIKKFKPSAIFSKGSFVGLPVAYAGFLSRIPVVIHESDMTPGLSNKLAVPVCKKVCCNFPETVKNLPKKKAVLTGSPIREEIFSGDVKKGLEMCGFSSGKPVIMIIGGSLGAASINKAIREALPSLLSDFQVVHLCGKDKLDESLNNTPGYCQFEYVSDGISDLFAMADLVVSRAGANSICELLALKKPNLLIPLVKASRGDQILNAKSFESQGYSMVLNDDECTSEALVEKITQLYFLRQTFIDAMSKSTQNDAIKAIIDVINSQAK